MKIYAKIEADKVVAAFGSSQDPDVWGELVEIEDDDARYLSFVAPPDDPVVTDPLDKLKAFLAANPDVAEILK